MTHNPLVTQVKSVIGLGGPIYWRAAAKLSFAAFLLTARMGWRFTTS